MIPKVLVEDDDDPAGAASITAINGSEDDNTALSLSHGRNAARESSVSCPARFFVMIPH